MEATPVNHAACLACCESTFERFLGLLILMHLQSLLLQLYLADSWNVVFCTRSELTISSNLAPYFTMICWVGDQSYDSVLAGGTCMVSLGRHLHWWGAVPLVVKSVACKPLLSQLRKNSQSRIVHRCRLELLPITCNSTSPNL